MRQLADINALSEADFVAAFGDVAEHSPWVAEQAATHRPFADRAAMIAAFEQTLRAAGPEAQLALVRAHPDLATRARLTADSANEQKGVGLDSLTAAEFARFTDFNERHKRLFGFPFIFAVKGATKHQILAAFADRIDKTKDEEFAITLDQVARIFRFRIEDRVTS